MRNYHVMNKIYKAVTALTLTAIIGTSQFGALQAQEGIIDIRGHFYEASIQRMFDQGVLRGYGNGVFAPDQSVTIAQAVQMMVNL
ncbi:MAG: S-layer homology domain-containing protein, partial [Vallitaleaceae bacterium]|nr:S-layer homology domain-containing protein [Vallitaleaceae bacterium]